jgi:hypothetical protein
VFHLTFFGRNLLVTHSCSSRNRGGLPISITGDGVIHDSSRNGVFNVRYVFGVPFQGTLMTVVDTDYQEYAVLYSCTNSILPRVFHTEYIWILTRKGILSNPSRQNIYTKLDSLKINRNQLQLSDRVSCPAVNASGPAREEPPSNSLTAVPLSSYVKSAVKPVAVAAPSATPSSSLTSVPSALQSTSGLTAAQANTSSSSTRIASVVSAVVAPSQPIENTVSKEEIVESDTVILNN